MVGAGRVLLCELEGVAIGVERGLTVPTRDFLEDERGVMLWLRNDLTGVEMSSCAAVVARGVVATLLRTVRAD
jgi:hypothetical protein